MNLETNISIDYSTGVGSTSNGVVKGYLGTKAFMEDGSLTVNYRYEAEGVIIKRDSMEVPKDNVQAMYDAVKSGLPSADADFNLYIETAFYKAFINEMVVTFSGLADASQVDLIS